MMKMIVNFKGHGDEDALITYEEFLMLTASNFEVTTVNPAIEADGTKAEARVALGRPFVIETPTGAKDNWEVTVEAGVSMEDALRLLDSAWNVVRSSYLGRIKDDEASRKAWREIVDNGITAVQPRGSDPVYIIRRITPAPQATAKQDAFNQFAQWLRDNGIDVPDPNVWVSFPETPWMKIYNALEGAKVGHGHFVADAAFWRLDWDNLELPPAGGQ